jgi:hypothetical protein
VRQKENGELIEGPLYPLQGKIIEFLIKYIVDIPLTDAHLFYG